MYFRNVTVFKAETAGKLHKVLANAHKVNSPSRSWGKFFGWLLDSTRVRLLAAFVQDSIDVLVPAKELYQAVKTESPVKFPILAKNCRANLRSESLTGN